MHILKRIKIDFNKMLLLATSLVAIGAFLFTGLALLRSSGIYFAGGTSERQVWGQTKGEAVLTAVWTARPLGPNHCRRQISLRLKNSLRPLAYMEKNTGLREREAMLVDYGVYTLDELARQQELYKQFRQGEALSSLDIYQKISLWQYLIVSDLHQDPRHQPFFKEIEESIKSFMKVEQHKRKIDVVLLEIGGLYVGYHWRGIMELEDKVASIVQNRIINSNSKVLDIGCGDGSVIIALSKQYPNAQFVGIDAYPFNIARAIDTLADMKKEGLAAPRNIKFHIRDCREQLPKQKISTRGIMPVYKANTFDVALMLEGVTDEDSFDDAWEYLLWREIIRATKKDGGKIAFFGHEGEGAFMRCARQMGLNATQTSKGFYKRGGFTSDVILPWSSRHHRMAEDVNFNVYDINPKTREKVRLLLALEMPSSRSKTAQTKIASVITECLMNKRNILGAKEDLIEDVLDELMLNTMEHGKGGVLSIYLVTDEAGVVKLRAIAADKGNGLPGAPNMLVKNSLDSHAQMGRRAGPIRGMGMLRIALDPDTITIEHNGRKFVRVTNDPAAQEWFREEIDGSEIVAGKGMRICAEFILGREPNLVELRVMQSAILRPVAAGERESSQFSDAYRKLKDFFTHLQAASPKKQNYSLIFFKGGDLGAFNPVLNERIMRLLGRDYRIKVGNIKHLSTMDVLIKWREMVYDILAAGQVAEFKQERIAELAEIISDKDRSAYFQWRNRWAQYLQDNPDEKKKDRLYGIPVMRLLDFFIYYHKKPFCGVLICRRPERTRVDIVRRHSLELGEIYLNQTGEALRKRGYTIGYDNIDEQTFTKGYVVLSLRSMFIGMEQNSGFIEGARHMLGVHRDVFVDKKMLQVFRTIMSRLGLGIHGAWDYSELIGEDIALLSVNDAAAFVEFINSNEGQVEAAPVPMPDMAQQQKFLHSILRPPALKEKRMLSKVRILIDAHLKAYHIIREKYGNELWDDENGRYTYTMTHPDYGVSLVHRLRRFGYLKNGARFADLGCANGFMVHLVNAMVEDVETVGYDIDERLLTEARRITSELPIIDTTRLRLENKDYLDKDVDLSTFDVLYIYPPMHKARGWRPVPPGTHRRVVTGLAVSVDLTKVISKMKIGAIIVLNEGGKYKPFAKSPYLKYVPGADVYMRVENRRLYSKIWRAIKSIRAGDRQLLNSVLRPQAAGERLSTQEQLLNVITGAFENIFSRFADRRLKVDDAAPFLRMAAQQLSDILKVDEIKSIFDDILKLKPQDKYFTNHLDKKISELNNYLLPHELGLVVDNFRDPLTGTPYRKLFIAVLNQKSEASFSYADVKFKVYYVLKWLGDTPDFLGAADSNGHAVIINQPAINVEIERIRAFYHKVRPMVGFNKKANLSARLCEIILSAGDALEDAMHEVIEHEKKHIRDSIFIRSRFLAVPQIREVFAEGALREGGMIHSLFWRGIQDKNKADFSGHIFELSAYMASAYNARDPHISIAKVFLEYSLHKGRPFFWTLGFIELLRCEILGGERKFFEPTVQDVEQLFERIMTMTDENLRQTLNEIYVQEFVSPALNDAGEVTNPLIETVKPIKDLQVSVLRPQAAGERN